MSAVAQALAIGSGGLVGFSLGLIGGGGSILATPLLLYVVGIAEPHIAIGTSALAVSAIAFMNLISHSRAGNVRWRSAMIFAVTGSVGAIVGSTLGKSFNGDKLLFLFGLIMLVVGELMLRPRTQALVKAERPSDAASSAVLIVTAFIVGLASGFFGIGGGFLIVPGLILATGMPMLNAVGTSLLAVGAFGLMTALNYAVSGLVEWSVAIEFVAGGLIGGLIGISLCNRLAKFKGVLNAIFASLIFVVALYVLLRSTAALVA